MADDSRREDKAHPAEKIGIGGPIREGELRYQDHGYRSGHQLLASNIKLPHEDQDTVDRLSDMAGSLRPGETFAPYLTMYPLPSRSHYVVARTWQDVKALRAGCVLTRSMFVPMRLWQESPNIEQMISMVDLEKSEVGGFHVPPVTDDRTVQLVEALFLETRQPIVYFEADEAEAIAIRVVAALWPGLRKNFSVGSFALSPRRIEGRDFDLLFAPRSARSRFADWSGRRVDVVGQIPRHRWSVKISDQIFRAAKPTLGEFDALGVLTSDDSGDEGALRLALLWNELRDKASESPTAVLGLLDIVNSQKLGATRTMLATLVPLITRALFMLGNEQLGERAWRFIEALVGKLVKDEVPAELWQAIEKSASELSERSREATLVFLEADPNRARPLPKVIIRGIGNGFAKIQAPISGVEFAAIPSEVAAEMLAESPMFSERVLGEAKAAPNEWVAKLASAMRSAGPDLKEKLRGVLVRFVDSDGVGPVVSILLEGAIKQDFAKFMADLIRYTKVSSVGVFDAVVDSARAASALSLVRATIIAEVAGESADMLLRRTVRVDDRDDLSWILGGDVSISRKRVLIAGIVGDASERELRSLPRQISQDMIVLLLADPRLYGSEISRLVSTAELPSEIFFDAAFSVLPHLGDEAPALRDILIDRAFTEADLNDVRIVEVVNSASKDLDGRQLVLSATRRSIAPERLDRNLQILNGLGDKLRTNILQNIDELSARLIRHAEKALGAATYRTWAELLADASHFSDAQLRAAMPVLAFAIRQTDRPVSPLIVVSFPVVYRQLLLSKGEEDFGRWPALLTLPFSYFVDWDRAKAARNDLADSFVSSIWPPVDLLTTAARAGIEIEVIKRLIRHSRGRDYLERALDEAGTTEPDLKTRFLNLPLDQPKWD